MKAENQEFKCQNVQMSLCWSLGHAEQVLFSCLGSKVTVYSRKLQWFFFDILIHTRSTDIRVHRAGSQLKTYSEQGFSQKLAYLRPSPLKYSVSCTKTWADRLNEPSSFGIKLEEFFSCNRLFFPTYGRWFSNTKS